MVYGKGINDMGYGWIKVDEWNYRVYHVWAKIIQRCYDEKFHEKNLTYKNCYVCERWLYLSNFVEDIVKIPNYEYWRDNPNQRISLDKDIKSNGQNKCYCLENCCFTTIEENCRQATKTRDTEKLKGENHPRATLVDRFTLDGQYVDTKYHFEYAQMGFNKSNISHCCKGRIKSTGGYVFKYHKEES